ncbi:MAG TPA: hypothetical protein VK897_13550, partial [Anaerolineales bacterium]|nr:hypothetical protein [Anaerolineales bacterium]
LFPLFLYRMITGTGKIHPCLTRSVGKPHTKKDIVRTPPDQVFSSRIIIVFWQYIGETIGQKVGRLTSFAPELFLLNLKNFPYPKTTRAVNSMFFTS